MRDALNLKQGSGSCQIVLSAKCGAPADVLVTTGSELKFGSRHLQVRLTPGHTDGCMSLVLDDQSAVFTGDTLLIRGCGRTDFQQGDPARLFQSVREHLFSLPDSAIVYPGHDYNGVISSTIFEEKNFNDDLSLKQTEAAFVNMMQSLQLQPPKQLHIAVPLNMQNGYATSKNEDGGASGSM